MNLDEDYELTNDPYVDPVSGILKNLLGITDAVQLRAVEHDISYATIARILADQPWHLTDIDFDLLLALHKRIFGAIYQWAGELRTIEVSKSNTRFAFSQYLDDSGRSIFAKLAAEHYLANLQPDGFVTRLAYYYSELNILHPFREGNGRTIRTLLSILAYQAHGCLESVLTANPLTSPLLSPVSDLPGIYSLNFPHGKATTSLDAAAGLDVAEQYRPESGLSDPIYVTFTRKIADESEDDLVLLTYGTPELTSILPRMELLIPCAMKPVDRVA